MSSGLKPAEAIPPKWNVLIVSCVPGSPMDWAAMMPIDSPIPTTLPVARLSAVALGADAAAAFANKRRADADRFDACIVDRFGLAGRQNVASAGKDLGAVARLIDIFKDGPCRKSCL